MAVGEFELIQKYFARSELTAPEGKASPVALGIGDDCALLDIPSGMQLAQSMDTLVEGVHFPKNAPPFALGYRALAVNLSDLAAMGAEPHSFTLGLTLPDVSPEWLASFSDGLACLAKQFKIALIGGDTTRGPLTITIQAQGLIPTGKAMLRSRAQPGDLICVTGTLGDAAGALPAVLKGECPESASNIHVRQLLNRYWYPTPRILEGQWLRRKGATAALDISDGILGDLRHILKASDVGAEIDPSLVPISPALKRTFHPAAALKTALTGGDDYELCFTIPRDLAMTLPPEINDDCKITCIGQVTSESGALRDSRGRLITAKAYTHF
ncbi:thiamine-phosphate kinase [Endozoicomonas ascidiicola]|uniref:thiamine-phosphate kinase n=1 Tax=Endozoicomonas ascidiicola TaxID=1698521 RepID=UPI00082A8EBF|nr:thiamine-phosphate kinase [Endozoicomonas ascidiicola]